MLGLTLEPRPGIFLQAALGSSWTGPTFMYGLLMARALCISIIDSLGQDPTFMGVNQPTPTPQTNVLGPQSDLSWPGSNFLAGIWKKPAPINFARIKKRFLTQCGSDLTYNNLAQNGCPQVSSNLVLNWINLIYSFYTVFFWIEDKITNCNFNWCNIFCLTCRS